MVRRRTDPNVVETSTLDKETALYDLKSLMSNIFMDSQKPNANLRADAIKLRDLQVACCLNSPRLIGQPEDIDIQGEAQFHKMFNKMVNVILAVKKNEPTADRVQRFIAGFLQYIQSKDEEAKSKAKEGADKTQSPSGQEEDERMAEASELDDEEEGDYETVTSRFVDSFLRHLFKGFSDAKVAVRTRCCQIIALSISSMGELDEDLYQDLKSHLFEGHLDKDASVRAQAVTALCRLQSDTEPNASDEQTIHDKLMWSMRRDTSAEVRRLVLFNIDVTPETIPYFVQSIRDPDDTNRRVVYLKPLSDIPDFKMLSFEQRHDILKWGLDDRIELVRKAALKLFSEKWIVHANNNLIEFLERLEATKPILSPLVEKLLKEFFKERMDIVNDIVFDEEFWSNLSGESALLAKTVIEFLQAKDNTDERLDVILPEVTRHVFNLENYYNLYRTNASAEDAASTNYEFILTQLLDISLCLDYADEVGRRKMFEFLRQVLKSQELIDDHLERIVKVFRMISIDERDFTRSIIEIVSDIQEEDEAMASLADLDETPTKRARVEESTEHEEPSQGSDHQLENLVVRFRCLSICKRMLENSYETLTENSSLYGLLNDLIVPAVQSGDHLLREEGLHCLGLCCMLDKHLAQHNIKLFITCIKHGHEGLVKKAIKIFGDILLMYGVDAMAEYLSSSEDIHQVFEFGLDHDNTEIQSFTTQALCKLMLFNRFEDEELLGLMILLYFFPKTEIDEACNTIHQCLAYFFPVFCYSSPTHQKSLSNITLSSIKELCRVHADLAQDETMVDPKTIAEMLADWNDPEKLQAARSKDPNYIEGDDEAIFQVSGGLAIETLETIYTEKESELRKILCHFLLRLRLKKLSSEQMKTIQEMIHKIDQEKPIKNTLVRRAVMKIADAFEQFHEEPHLE